MTTQTKTIKYKHEKKEKNKKILLIIGVILKWLRGFPAKKLGWPNSQRESSNLSHSAIKFYIKHK
jgi:hypothetical protein